MENQQKATVGLQPTEPNTLYPVSYTHIDVYKRQVVYSEGQSATKAAFRTGY